jgi:CheY-like chemotaxis protein
MAVENVRLLVDAQEANRTKDEFLATVSHELRTPLNSILGWARMLSTGRLDEANAARAVQIIERNAKAQAQLIEDLLDISRIISGKMRLEVRSVDLVSVIEAAVDAVRLAAENKGIRIQRVLDSGVGLISGDPDRLQQVVWNLLSNAIKFTPRDGRVQVRLERSGSTAEVIVSDTGMGISPEFLPHVFERFRQLDSSSTRKHGGLGLGLAIVSQLVELHGGHIRVESEGKGKGATFTVTLPVAAHAESEVPERLPARAAIPAATGSPILDGVRVLVAEDEQDTREVLTVILQQCGAEVQAVASAGEAFEILRADWKPDVLVSDIEMPGEDGYVLIRRLRALEAERGGRIPAAALTAYARSEDRMRALSAGFQVHVPKPVEPEELIAVVASLSGRTSLMQARL